MPSYETTIITKPHATEDTVNSIKAKVESVITAHSGQVANFEDWGARKLAHEIQREGRGRYIFFGYTGNNATIAELERNLRLNENVMRFLSIQVAPEENMELLRTPSPMKRVKRPMAEDADSY